jgi:hypothetical protein
MKDEIVLLMSKHVRCVELLLEAGADPTIPNSGTRLKHDYSPLHSTITMVPLGERYGYHQNTSPVLERMIRGSFIAFVEPTSNAMGPSIWLSAFLWCSPPRMLVEHPLDAGCDVNETTANFLDFPDGLNCLFLLVNYDNEPGSSRGLETLRFLFSRHANVLATNASGLTIFDLVDPCRNTFSSYKRDLWYCALRREGIDAGPIMEVHPRITKYDMDYTPEHYRALCYLDNWTKEDLSQQVQDTLEACSWTKEELSELSRIRAEKEEVARTRRL